MQNENTTLEYYKYLRERVENSPLPFPTESPHPFFPELYKKDLDKAKGETDDNA